MKNKIIIVLLYLILSNYIQSKPLNINPERISCYYMMDFINVNNSIYIIGKTDLQINVVELFKLENDVITNLPIIIDGKEVKLITDKYLLKNDTEGNIYLLADGIYKYNGNTWEIIRINDDIEDKRTYKNIEIAKDNSIWFSTQLKFSETEELKTILYRYKDNKFDIVYARENPTLIHTLKALNNGNMLMQRIFSKKNKSDNAEFFKEDTLIENIKELYYWDENLNLKTESLVSSSGFDFINHNKSTNFIEEKDNILKFGFSAKIYNEYIDGTSFSGCCGGYVEKINNKWVIYDTTKGLHFNNNKYLNMKSIFSINDFTFLFWDNDIYSKIYYKQGINSFDTIKTSNLLENSECIFIRDIDEKNKDRFTINIPLSVYKAFEIDNYVYLCNQQFITKISKIFFQNITSININLKSNKFNLFPNPTSDFLNINEENINKIEIFDLIGNKVIETNYNETPINKVQVNELSKGLYQVVLYKLTGEILNTSFIKN